MNRRVNTGSDFLGGILAAITIFFVGGGLVVFLSSHLTEATFVILFTVGLIVFAFQKFTPRS